MLLLIFKLLFGHAIADFAMQSDAMSKGKNRNKKPDYIPAGQKFIACWPYWLTSHALIHGGVVFLATGMLSLGIAETILHWLIDFIKCENWTNPHQDQALHMLCKVFYVIIIIFII